MLCQAVAIMIARTGSGQLPRTGFSDIISAATPATIGAENEVPDFW